MEEPDPRGDRSDPWRPLEEHTPRSVSEAGLDLDPTSTGRLRIALLVLTGLVVAIGAFVLLRSDGDGSSILDVDAGACVAPVATDVDAPVAVVACEPGAARLLGRETHPADDDELHPGDGALELFGQGACQGRVDPERLVVAVPSPSSWAAGERAIACLERL